MVMFKYNSWKKFVIFSIMIIVPFAIILYIIAFFGGFIPSILMLGLLSIVLRIIVAEYGDRMLSKDYMSPDQIEEFEKKKINFGDW